jgi:sugar lactone lactonase YvrE
MSWSRNRDIWSVFTIVAVAFVCTTSEAQASGLTTVRALDAAKGELPESLTIDKLGNLYATMGPTVRKITPWGQMSTLATLPVPKGVLSAGLKFAENGDLYVATGSLSPVPPAAFVWRVSPGGVVSEFAALDPTGFPNDIAIDDDGALFVTDPLLGLLWKIDEQGQPDVWLADPAFEGNAEDPYLVLSRFGVDGIAFNKHKDRLYVGNLDYGQILRIDVDCGGEPGDVEVWVDDFDAIAGADGIAFDDKGTLFVAVNGQDRLVAIDKHRHIDIVAEGGLLDAPSGVVFGQSPWNNKTLYISSFAITRAYGIFPGPPHPALLKLPVKNKGLPLL